MGGDSGSATIDDEASGDDALGRVETPLFIRVRGPPESLDAEGTLRDDFC